MPTIGDTLDQALSSVERLRKTLSKSKTRQISAHDEQALIKATAFAWFNSCKPLMIALSGDGLLQGVNSQYRATLEASEKATVRSRLLTELKALKSSLIKLRSHVLALTTTGMRLAGCGKTRVE